MSHDQNQLAQRTLLHVAAESGQTKLLAAMWNEDEGFLCTRAQVPFFDFVRSVYLRFHSWVQVSTKNDSLSVCVGAGWCWW